MVVSHFMTRCPSLDPNPTRVPMESAYGEIARKVAVPLSAELRGQRRVSE